MGNLDDDGGIFRKNLHPETPAAMWPSGLSFWGIFDFLSLLS